MTTTDGTIVVAALGAARALARAALLNGKPNEKSLARLYLEQHDGARQAVDDLEQTAAEKAPS